MVIFGNSVDLVSDFYDLMAIFLTGPNPDGGNYESKNIAVVPESDPEQHVSVGTINNENNEEFYLDNTNGLTLQYDGFTIVLTAKASVVPCEVYNLKIAVADAMDMLFDSGVTIEASTINTPKIKVEQILTPSGISENMVEGCVEADLVFRLPNASYAPVTIGFEIVTGNGYAVNGIDYNWIDNFITFEEGQDSITLHIEAMMDNMPEGDEFIELIIENDLGCEIRYDTISLIIKDALFFGLPYYSIEICPGEEVVLSPMVHGGIEPITYIWEPGSYTTDTIVVSPDTTTTYTLTVSDMCGAATPASTTVVVFPDSLTDFYSFSFEVENNPELGEDIIGEISGDTIFLDIDGCVIPNILVAIFTYPTCANVFVNGVEQISGVTGNEFSYPVIYKVVANNGDEKDWTVIVDFGTGQNEITNSEIQIFPNPAKDKIYINDAEGLELSITNNLGLKLFQSKILNAQYSIDVGEFEAGVYYLKFENRDEWFVRKIVIE